MIPASRRRRDAQRDVVEHVGVDIAVLIDLRLGEHRETHIAQALRPRGGRRRRCPWRCW